MKLAWPEAYIVTNVMSLVWHKRLANLEAVHAPVPAPPHWLTKQSSVKGAGDRYRLKGDHCIETLVVVSTQ